MLSIEQKSTQQQATRPNLWFTIYDSRVGALIPCNQANIENYLLVGK